MRIYIKVAIVFFALLFGVVALTEYLSSTQKKSPFKLIDQVEEREVAFHADLTKVFLESEKYSKEAKLTLTKRVITGQVKQQLLKSGLKLNETYITYALYGNNMSSFYAEIHDTLLFEQAFNRLSEYFSLVPSEDDPFFYYSSSADLSIEKHSKYVKVNWGKQAALEKPNKGKKASQLFKSVLHSPSFGVINTTGTASLDSNNYATFTYEYNKDLRLTANWKVTKNHPLQLDQKTIPIYPSQKNNVQAYSNINIENLKQKINPFLKQKGIEYMEKLPKAAQELLELWNGQASLQMGGKTTKETVQYVTEFDDEFNQIERKVVKIDSLPDLGFYWGTNQPKKSVDALLRMPNVKMQRDQLQLALFPPLTIKQESSYITATTTNVDFKKEKSKYIVFINSERESLQGKLIIQSSSKDVVQLIMTLKDPVIPEKLNLSTFW